MATALYRRYRPETFAEVIGQDHVTTPLRRALRAGRVGHAYLFSGPRGCGKTTSARILARCLNCAEGPTDTPCGQCDSCRDLARGGPGSLDVVEIDAASHGGVEDARELRERATFAPARDRYKVFIIDEAHMVTSAGFNALLKLVEEPPEHVKFVFATTEPDKVIGTIRSRTHHYPFRLIPPQVLGPYLREVCEAENVQVGDGVLPLVVRAGGGSARDSMSVLDQLMAGAGENGLDHATAIALLGFTDTALLDRAVVAIAQRDAASLYDVLEQVIATGHEPRRFVEDLLERLRDLIILAAVPDRAADLLPQVPAEDLEHMREQAGMMPPADLSLCGDLVHETLSTMSGATSPRLHLELLAARLVLRDERAAGGGAVEAPAPQGAMRPTGGGDAGAPAAGSGREQARRIAAEKAEAARRAREGQAAPARGARDGGARDPQAGGAREAHAVAAHGRPVADAELQRPAEQTRPVEQQSRDEQTGPGEQQSRVEKSRPGEQQSPSVSRAAAPERHQQAVSGAEPSAAEGAVSSAAEPVAGARGSGPSLADVHANWSAILDQLQQIRRPSWALISQNAQPVAMNGSTLLLGFRTDGLVAAFHRGTGAANLAEAITRIMRVEVAVEATVGDGPAGGGTAGGCGVGPAGGAGGGASGGNAGRPSEGGSAETSSATDPSRGSVPAPHAGASRNSGFARASQPEREAEHPNRPAGGRPFSGPAEPDFAPEPDDPFPPDPDEYGPPAGEDFHSASPHRPAHGEPSWRGEPNDGSATRGSDAAGTGGAAHDARPVSGAGAASAGSVLEVEDEGRDSLPAGEPRTYGQAALRRALAEGRVVRSLPASGGGNGPSTDGAADPEVHEASGHAGASGHPTSPATPEPPASADTPDLAVAASPSDQHAPGARTSSSWGDAAGAWGASASQSGRSGSGTQETARTPAPAAPPTRTGADLAREAAQASLAAQRRRGPGGRAAHDPSDTQPGSNDDPTGGASRDDADAEYTNRNGRDVIESILGGRVLEVIDETDR